VACLEEPTNVSTVQNKEGTVSLDFSAIIPEMQPSSKALGDSPSLQNLYLAVFDEEGYLAEYVKANLKEVATGNNVYCKYSVTLSLSDTRRTIHWIANAPENMQYGSEEAVMMKLKTSGNQDTYWYRKVVERIDVSDQDQNEPSDYLKSTLDNIPLIRNFAKIQLVDNADSFELISYTVVNTPNESYTVAYNFSKGEYVDYMKMKDGSAVPKSYKELRDEGYDASIPILTSYVSLTEAWDRKVSSSSSCYVYEREKPLVSPAYIIASGKYNGSEEERFYKINLRDESGNYIPIFRNFQYTINLNAVYRNGYKTIGEAAASTGSGDVSTALETESLIFMSDGNASLQVDYTDIVVTSNQPITLGFAFYPDLRDPSSLYKGIPTEYNESIEVIKNDDEGAAGESIKTVAVDYTGGIPTITITPTNPEDTPKKQTLTIIARYTHEQNGEESHRSLQRNIKVTVMNDQMMTLTCNPFEIPKIDDYKFGLDISIPDGLSRGMFPLDFKIESSALTITPDLDRNQLNAETGKSVTGSGKPAYFFIKNIDWYDYQSLQNVEGKKTIKVYLQVTKKESATDIYVANEYFYGKASDDSRKGYAAVNLGNYDPIEFQNINFNPSQLAAIDNQPVTLSFEITDVPEDNKIILLLDNLEPAIDETRLTKIDGLVDGKVQYEFPVESASITHEIKLISPLGNKESSVTLRGHHFIEASKALQHV
jgi:hypothetical protein